MIDVETWATSADAALLQVGAVAFDFDHTLEPHEHLQRESLIFTGTVEPSFEYSGAVRYDADTQAWWAHAERQRAMCSILEMAGRDDAKPVLERFADWVSRNVGRQARVWAKPPIFDLAVLRHNFTVFGVECPWHFRQEADLRTLAWAAQHVLGAEFHVPDIVGAGMIKHNALHDAAVQATLAQAALRALVLHERRWGSGKKTAKV
jgi:hypothetical protein